MVKKQLHLLNKVQMLDIFNHYYRTCFVANPTNKNAPDGSLDEPSCRQVLLQLEEQQGIKHWVFLRSYFFSSLSEIYR